MKRISRAAFTLVELSIVLVILGLLVGGVLSGQSLIHAAELRAIGVEKDKYVTALHAFQDKYLALPGDMPNAYAFWGDDCGTNASAQDDQSGCNGNGDGRITILFETRKVWEHLSRAGLVEGNYRFAAPVGDLLSSTMPASKYSGGFWGLGESQIMDSWASRTSTDFPVTLVFGNLAADVGMSGEYANSSILHPLLSRADAWNLDKKMDDGWASTGSVRGGSLIADTHSCDDGIETQSVNGNDVDVPVDPFSLATSGAADTAYICALGFILQK